MKRGERERACKPPTLASAFACLSRVPSHDISHLESLLAILSFCFPTVGFTVGVRKIKALTICMENLVIQERIQMERFIPFETFWGKR